MRVSIFLCSTLAGLAWAKPALRKKERRLALVGRQDPGAPASLDATDLASSVSTIEPANTTSPVASTPTPAPPNLLTGQGQFLDNVTVSPPGNNYGSLSSSASLSSSISASITPWTTSVAPPPVPSPRPSALTSGSAPAPSDLPFIAVLQWTNETNALSACNTTYGDNDTAVILNADLYGDPDEVSPLCGLSLWINNAEGVTVEGTVQDVCEGSRCGDIHGLVLTKGFFTQVGGDPDTGILAAIWGWSSASMPSVQNATLPTAAPPSPGDGGPASGFSGSEGTPAGAQVNAHQDPAHN